MKNDSDHVAVNLAEPDTSGWKWVPVSPTLDMIRAAQFHTEHDDDAERGDPKNYRARGQAMAVYMDMLAAAPSVPTKALADLIRDADRFKFLERTYLGGALINYYGPQAKADRPGYFIEYSGERYATYGEAVDAAIAQEKAAQSGINSDEPKAK